MFFRFYYTKKPPLNPGLFAVLYAALSNIAIGFCFIPVVMIWKWKLQYNKAYLFTAIYWLANGLMNLPGIPGLPFNQNVIRQVTLIYNLLDAPLILLVFLASATGSRKRSIRYTIWCFIIFELIMIAWKGFNLTSSTVIIGVGTCVAIVFSVMGVMEYIQKIEHSADENVMVFVYASFLFAYGIFIVIYFFSYLKVAGSNPSDNFIIYYFSLLLSTLLTSLGFWKFARRSVTDPVS